MSIIEEIKRDVRHDRKCRVWLDGQTNLYDESRECNCSRRRKIALLERLQEPTRKMLYAAFDAGGGPEFERAYKAALKAAEEWA